MNKNESTGLRTGAFDVFSMKKTAAAIAAAIM